MEVKVCKNCRRLFKYIYGPEICPDCVKLLAGEKQEQKEQDSKQNTLNPQEAQNNPNNKPLIANLKALVKDEEAKFDQVRDYIMTHPGASVVQIAEANDVQPTKLFEWIRDDRLEFSDESEYAWFTCGKCGAKIRSGRLCNRCKTK